MVLLIVMTMVSAGIQAYPYFFKPINQGFDDIARKLAQLDFENKRTHITEDQLAQLEKIAAKSSDNQLKARAMFWRVRSTQMDAQPPKCIEILEKARTLCSSEYDYDLACIDYQLAGNYDRMGRYLDAYTLLQSTLPVFERHEDYYFLGNAYLLLAQLFIDIEDTDNVTKPLQQAKEAYRKVGFPLNRIYFFEAFLAKGENKKIKLYQQSVTHDGSDWGMDIQALCAMSELKLKMDQPQEALAFVDKADRLLDRMSPGNTLFRSMVAVTRATVLYHRGEMMQVKSILMNEMAHAELLAGERILSTIYELLWRVNEQQGNERDAYQYLKLYQQEYKRMGDSIRSQDIPKAQAREAIARHNDSIRLLEQDAELSRRFMYMSILVCVVVLLVCTVLFVYFRQRLKIKKVENRELRNNLQQEALIYSMNRKNFEQDIKQKECEISSSTLLLANKNEVLQQISDITRKYQEMGSIPAEYVKQVNDVIGDSLKNDDEWQRFKLHFDSVHPDFFVKLKEAGTGLTENDLRLCAYIRIGMRAKQIAEMLSVSPDSVNSNRYRLRKKLKIQKGDSLDDFIRKI